MATITSDLKVVQIDPIEDVLSPNVGIEQKVETCAQPIIKDEETLLYALARRLESAEMVSSRIETKVDGVDRNVSTAVTAAKVAACFTVFIDAGVTASTVVCGLLCTKGAVVVA